MRNHTTGLLAVLVFLLLGAPTHAADLYTYDLDSLVYMGPEVVEGALAASPVTNDAIVWPFKISAVDNGSLKVGQSINVAALDFFRVATNGVFWTDTLKAGDHLFLFLARATNRFLYETLTNDNIYEPAPSGLRLIVGNKALPFRQFMNPGPLTAVLEGAATNPAVPTVADLRRQIRASIPRVDSWRPLLDQKPASNNIPALLQILRQRPHSRDGFYTDVDQDFIAGQICLTLALLHDPKTLLEAAQISGYRWVLAAGFRTTGGREFLRRHLADAQEPVENRILCAQLLNHASIGEPSEWRFQWLAQLAAQPNQNPKLQIVLVQSLRALAQWPEKTNAPALLQDQKEAGAILTQLAKDTPSEELKYNIDLALPVLGLSPLSSNNCLLQFDHYDRPARTLHLTCRISRVSGLLHPSVAFLNVTTGRKWNAPSNLYFHGDEAESPGDVAVPRDLPPGHYRVFYEFTENGAVKSASHYFETDL